MAKSRYISQVTWLRQQIAGGNFHALRNSPEAHASGWPLLVGAAVVLTLCALGLWKLAELIS